MDDEARKEFAVDSQNATNDILRFVRYECTNKESYSLAGAMCGLVNVMALLSISSGISFESFKSSMTQSMEFYESRWGTLKKEMEMDYIGREREVD